MSNPITPEAAPQPLTAEQPRRLAAVDGSATAKNYLWAAQNLERMAAEETDLELRRLWLKASAIGREKAKSPNGQSLATGTHELP